MSENPQNKPDFLEVARHQLAQLTAEFEKAVEAVKEPERRKQLTLSYLDMLQKGLSWAQDSVARYQEKIAPHPASESPSHASAPGPSATPTEPAPGPPESNDAQPQAPSN
jgi:hypothetical protein